MTLPHDGKLRARHAQRIGARQLPRVRRLIDVGGVDRRGLESDLSQQVEPSR